MTFPRNSRLATQGTSASLRRSSPAKNFKRRLLDGSKWSTQNFFPTFKLNFWNRKLDTRQGRLLCVKRCGMKLAYFDFTSSISGTCSSRSNNNDVSLLSKLALKQIAMNVTWWRHDVLGRYIFLACTQLSFVSRILCSSRWSKFPFFSAKFS